MVREPSRSAYGAVMELRELVTDDATAVARVHVRAWHAAYAGLIDAEVLAAITVEAREKEWREVWLPLPKTGPRVVAIVDDAVVGFVVGTVDSPSVDGCGEIYSIYVDPDHWGTGVGSALFRAAVAELRADAPRPLVLWVLEGNGRAIAFYEREGWQADGGRKDEQLGASSASHLRYRLD